MLLGLDDDPMIKDFKQFFTSKKEKKEIVIEDTSGLQKLQQQFEKIGIEPQVMEFKAIRQEQNDQIIQPNIQFQNHNQPRDSYNSIPRKSAGAVQNFKNDEDSSSRKQSNIYTGESKIGKGTKYLGKTKSQNRNQAEFSMTASDISLQDEKQSHMSILVEDVEDVSKTQKSKININETNKNDQEIPFYNQAQIQNKYMQIPVKHSQQQLFKGPQIMKSVPFQNQNRSQSLLQNDQSQIPFIPKQVKKENSKSPNKNIINVLYETWNDLSSKFLPKKQYQVEVVKYNQNDPNFIRQQQYLSQYFRREINSHQQNQNEGKKQFVVPQQQGFFQAQIPKHMFNQSPIRQNLQNWNKLDTSNVRRQTVSATRSQVQNNGENNFQRSLYHQPEHTHQYGYLTDRSMMNTTKYSSTIKIQRSPSDNRGSSFLQALNRTGNQYNYQNRGNFQHINNADQTYVSNFNQNVSQVKNYHQQDYQNQIVKIRNFHDEFMKVLKLSLSQQRPLLLLEVLEKLKLFDHNILKNSGNKALIYEILKQNFQNGNNNLEISNLYSANMQNDRQKNTFKILCAINGLIPNQRGANMMDDITLGRILQSIDINNFKSEENLINQLNILSTLIDRNEFTLSDGQIKQIHNKFQNFFQNRNESQTDHFLNERSYEDGQTRRNTYAQPQNIERSMYLHQEYSPMQQRKMTAPNKQHPQFYNDDIQSHRQIYVQNAQQPHILQQNINDYQNYKKNQNKNDPFRGAYIKY